MQLHCPECKSTNISPIVETTMNGGYAVNHSMSRRNSVSGIKMNSTHRNYWMCSNCGSKFRNVQNLEDELKGVRLKEMILRVFAIIFVAILFVILAVPSFRDLAFLCILCTALVVGSWLYTGFQKKKLEQEDAYLKEKCFD